MTVGEVIPVSPLPRTEDVGRTGRWTLPKGEGDDVVVIEGTFLGVASSRREHHRDHAGRAYADPGQRCGACRWFEPRIFYGRVEGTDGPDAYLVYRVGATVVPGERNLVGLEWLTSPFEVVEALTTRREGTAFLSIPAARVLSQAANFDRNLERAYVDRAVS